MDSQVGDALRAAVNIARFEAARIRNASSSKASEEQAVIADRIAEGIEAFSVLLSPNQGPDHG